MLESWNDGLIETGIQNAYYFIDFLILREFFSVKIIKQMLGGLHQQK
jgi:hypothetical protein